MSLDHFPATASLVPLLLFILLLSSSRSMSTKHGCSVDAIVNFGDSLSDTGNFLRISPLAFLSNRYPYGVTINKTTGRFSDGYLMIDIIAMRLGLPLLPPYFDRNASFANGVNFAVAGATALDASFLASNGITNPSTNVSLGVQLGWFHDYKRSLCPPPPPKNEFFRRTLFFVGEIGGNDFNYAFASSKTLEEMKTRYAPLVVAKITSAVEELIGAGAVNLVIPGIPPFGCAPFILSAIPKIDPRAYDENGCVIEINKVAQEYNLLLEKAMEMLRKQ